MSVLDGLAKYKERAAAQEAAREARSRGPVNRFKLEKDGDTAVVRFLQEIDYDASNYSEKNGIGFVNLEHNHPDPKNGWKNRASCTVESQGACYPCERVGDETVPWADRKGWKQKEKFYINIAAKKTDGSTGDVDQKTGDGDVLLLEQGTYNGIFDALALEAIDNGTITEDYYRITRKGSGFNDTSYVLSRLKNGVPEDAKPVEDFELYDIREDILREVPYANQKAFYHRGLETEVKQETIEKHAEEPADDVW